MAISQHGTSVLFTSHPKDRLVVNLYIPHNRRTPFEQKKLSVPFLYPGVPAGLTPFRGLVPLGQRNLVPILPPAHPLKFEAVELLKFEAVELHCTPNTMYIIGHLT